MNSFASVIDAFGIARAAEVLDVPVSHVRVLKARDNIPPAYFKKLVDAAEAADIKGVTYDHLYGLRSTTKKSITSSSAPASSEQVPA